MYIYVYSNGVLYLMIASIYSLNFNISKNGLILPREIMQLTNFEKILAQTF